MAPAGSCVCVCLVCWRLPVCICECVCVCLVNCALTTCLVKASFNFVYFVLLAESTEFSSIRKPYTYTSVSNTTVAVRKFLAYENQQTLEYKIFTRTKISAITVIKFGGVGGGWSQIKPITFGNEFRTYDMVPEGAYSR